MKRWEELDTRLLPQKIGNGRRRFFGQITRGKTWSIKQHLLQLQENRVRCEKVNSCQLLTAWLLFCTWHIWTWGNSRWLMGFQSTVQRSATLWNWTNIWSKFHINSIFIEYFCHTISFLVIVTVNNYVARRLWVMGIHGAIEMAILLSLLFLFSSRYWRNTQWSHDRSRKSRFKLQ